MQRNSNGKKRELTLSAFLERHLHLNDKIIKFNGFELYKNNQRSQDFFKNYIEKRDNELLPFQIKRYTDEKQTYIMNQNSQDFIVVEYIEEGIFLNEIAQNKISFQTFQTIFQNLVLSVFELHKRGILARCISSNNIYYERLEDKIYLFEFGFSPNCRCNQLYQPNYDITLIIEIMKDLYNKGKDIGTEFLEFKNKIYNLEMLLNQMNIIESYFKLYQLIKGSPSQEELQKVYTKEWVSDMRKKIQLFDFPDPIPIQINDSEQTDGEQRTYLELQELAIKLFKKQYPNEHTQLGYMYVFLYILYEQTNFKVYQNQVQKYEEKIKKINEERSSIEKSYDDISDTDRSIIFPSQIDKDPIRQKEIKMQCKAITYQTYKKLFEDKMQKFVTQQSIKEFTLEEARICLLLIASLNTFRSMDIEAIYKSNGIQDKVNKINEIIKQCVK
ncbi:unnamed protein product [Paramecium octaurelia]|uniref:Protein kinase domain-containing protein n=1 Tax=Paramecium octaurelia TaxID=43137 RepID=A0A8S1YGS5_PAROT|nr:unnamed protein product [Paramecium octaurelia]